MLAVRGRATGDVNVLAIYEERRIIATSGGLLGSRTWTQIMSDALGKPITASMVGEASSGGAALLVLEAMGR